MCHPLYPTACGMVGRPVYVHHVTGRIYHGTLLSVAPHGIYLMPHRPGARLVSDTISDTILDSRISDTGNEVVSKGVRGEGALVGRKVDAALVYAPGSYFAFGALAGLSLGAFAGGLWW